MPNIEASKSDLENLVGRKFSEKELEDALLYVKGEIESFEGDFLKIDIKETNRPDLWSTEGIARELRSRLGIERGIPELEAKPSGITVTIEPGLEKIRPLGVYAVARGVKITDESLRQLIQLQEKICLTFGRKRREVAIGIFDANKVKGDCRYFCADPSLEFIPLGFSRPMSLREILYSHPKGKEYAFLLEKFERFPLLVDSGNEVLSMPPIINSEGSGKVTESTRNLFIDVTGFRQENIEVALRIICLALADRGATIQSVQVKREGKTITTPSFGSKKIFVPLNLVESYTGLDWHHNSILELLQRGRMEGKLEGKRIEVSYPDYRLDILHAADVIEDLLISYGYNKIEPAPVKMPLMGSQSKETLTLDACREALIGLGLQEILTFVLTSRDRQEKMILLKDEGFAEISNPVSASWHLMRKRLFPEVLGFLSRNKHCAFPQNIFEVGKALELKEGEETGVRERNAACVVLCHSEANFTNAKSMLESLCRARRTKFRLEKKNYPFFIKGRAAELSCGRRTGFIGEVHPEVLQNFGIEMPVAVFEIEV